MKCWECKKQISRSTRVAYVAYCQGEAYESQFRDVCEDCYELLPFNNLHHVPVKKIRQRAIKPERG